MLAIEGTSVGAGRALKKVFRVLKGATVAFVNISIQQTPFDWVGLYWINLSLDAIKHSLGSPVI